MTTSKLVRWGGLALIVGALLVVAGDIAQATVFGDQPLSQQATTATYALLQYFLLLAVLLLTLGVFGLYARQAGSAGALGVIALVVVVAGLLLTAGAEWAAAFVAPSVAPVAPDFLDVEDPGGPLGVGFILSYLLAYLGLVLLGVSTAISKALPAWAGWALVVGTVVSFALAALLNMVIVTDVVLAAGLVAAGYALWSDKAAAGPTSGT